MFEPKSAKKKQLRDNKPVPNSENVYGVEKPEHVSENEAVSNK